MPDSIDVVLRDHPSCFSMPAPYASYSAPNVPTASFATAPPKLLFGKDPYLLSGLLDSIQSEATNRHLSVSAVYDPFLPHRLIALSVEGVGDFTLSPDELTVEGGLVDCTLLSSEETEGTTTHLNDLSAQKRTLAKEIMTVGRLLADAKSILCVQGSRLCDCAALRAKAHRVAQKLPKREGGLCQQAIQSYDAKGIVTYLPFGREVRILGLPGKYSLASLFLTQLADALSANDCRGILLTEAFTEEILGIYLPQMNLCYLTDAPEDIREKELSLSRYLHPFTADERRCYRRLATSVEAIESHLRHQLNLYRTLVEKEQALLADLHNESRLQTFRKRLLIDLFCS